ncbi:MAG: hypothetical protein KH321_03060 [Clostridium sp.]|nr:hypothetical protein [Clostridium sp.]
MKATEVIQPIAISQPIANQGTKFNIPEAPTGSELASIAEGFPDITMKALDDGGLPPRGQDCNGMFYLSTDQRVFLQNGGIITFNETVSNTIKGYPSGAVLDYIDPSGTFKKVQSLIDDNTNNFVTNPGFIDNEKWKEIPLGDGGGGDTGGGFSLFDVVEKDHILSFEESMGFGLLGTYVYKEPVAGSRYGYPDFYNECVAQKSTEGNTLLALKNNVEIVGSPVVNNGVLSGFSTSSYATTLTFPTDEDFDFQFKLKTGADISGEQEIFACPTASEPSQYYFCLVNLESNNLNVIFNGGLGVWQYPFGTPAQPETDYIVKVVYSKTNNTLHVTMSLANGTVLLDDTKQVDELYDIKEAVIGTGKDNAVTIFNPFKGSVDLKECYIESNGQRIWSGASVATKNPNGHIFYDIADKATVDEIFAQRGEAWFYGVDTENERVFLPRGTRSQYTVNTDETGDYVEAGLPNIAAKASIGFSDDNPTSDLPPFVFDSVVGNSSGGPSGEKRFKFDASTVNTIYGNSDTVQPYATKKLLYIVVGNVKVQSAASDVVDVTTTENDTVPLFTGQYFNFKPNNPSWLKAGEQQDSGGIYTSCYNKLVQALTDNIWEIKVIDSTAMEEGTDYSEYWIVYQDAIRFRTPLTACKEIMPGNEITSSLGFSSNPTNTVESYTVPYNGYITIIGYKTSTSNTLTVKLNGAIVSQTRALSTGQSSESYFFARKGDIVTVSTDSASTGWVIATQTITKATANGELYFKAASAIENLEILNVGQVMEELSNKVDLSHTSWAINACMPDYTAQTTFTLPDIGQTFTAPYDCLLFVSIFNAGAGNFELRYNNSNGGLIMFGSAGSNQVHVSQTAYLKKGWQIYRGGQIGYNQCYITPLIGAEGAN